MKIKKFNLVIFVMLFIGLISSLINNVMAQEMGFTRIAGNNRIETSIEISKAGWKTSEYVIIATANDFPDALSSAPLAKAYNAPILLVNPQGLQDKTKNELERLKVKNAIIIGGVGAISNLVQKDIEILGIKTKRIEGINRYETSLAIANEIKPNNEAIIATGSDFPDALSIAAYAASKKIPILLTEKDKLFKGIIEYINKNNIKKTYIVGGNGVVGDTVKDNILSSERIAGKDRYETNLNIIKKFYKNTDLGNIYLAIGDNFPDALAGAPLSSITKSPIILLNKNSDKAVKEYIKTNANNINKVKVLGGQGIIGDKFIKEIIKTIKVKIQEKADLLIKKEESKNIEIPIVKQMQDEATQMVDINSNKNYYNDKLGTKILKVNYIDVDLGDAILLQYNNHNLLIDTGSNLKSKKVIDYLISNKVTTLDYVIGTYPNENHIGGLEEVLNKFKVNNIVLPKIPMYINTSKSIKSILNKKKANLIEGKAGTFFELGEDVKIDILAPNKESYRYINNYSIVTKVTFKNRSFIFTGDAEATSEKEMISKGINLKSDVIKIGHHGSSSSTSENFLDLVSPQYAIISVGKGNAYGYPYQHTLDKLEKRGIKLYRTDENGNIIVTSNGNNLVFTTEK